MANTREAEEARDRARDAARRVKAEKMAKQAIADDPHLLAASALSAALRGMTTGGWQDLARSSGCNPPSSDETYELVISLVRMAEYGARAVQAGAA